VSNEVVWRTLRNLEVEVWLVKEVMTMYDNARTVVEGKMGIVRSLR